MPIQSSAIQMFHSLDTISSLVRSISQQGRQNPSPPPVHEVEPLSHFFRPGGGLDIQGLDKRDGACTRREILLRFLLLCAVLDQGPDLSGVRKLTIEVTNSLYREEIRFLHRPVDFFKEIGLAIDEILKKHEAVRNIRAAIWGQENQANPNRYNLFIDNSKQALNYAIFRWGVPLALPLVLERDTQSRTAKESVLVDYLESWPSAEIMSQQLKDHQRYGLGKAIGDKACHLFAKWMVSSFGLTRKKGPGWDDFSFEVPFDSNAGRVLWRAGYLLFWAPESLYQKTNVVQPGKGKQGLNYLRVTNIRGMEAGQSQSKPLLDAYKEIATHHLKTHKRSPAKIEIQRIQHAILLEDHNKTGLKPSDFDDGLIFIGTNFCFNHSNPACSSCPIQQLCEGYQVNKNLIHDYRT